MPELRYIYYWPDGTWIDRDETGLHEMSHMSDDFGLLVLPLDTSDEEIDVIINDGTPRNPMEMN